MDLTPLDPSGSETGAKLIAISKSPRCLPYLLSVFTIIAKYINPSITTPVIATFEPQIAGVLNDGPEDESFPGLTLLPGLVRQMNESMDVQERTIDQYIHASGRARNTQTLQNLTVLVFLTSSAHFESQYILIVPDPTVYIHPYKKLTKAHINESSAVLLVIGSSAAPDRSNIVPMAKINTGEAVFTTFQSLSNESINSSKQLLP